MDFDYETAKQEFINELMAGEYDIEISPNEEEDYKKSESIDFEAFREYLNSDESKCLSAEAFGK